MKKIIFFCIYLKNGEIVFDLEEIKGWKKLLDEGEIDEVTYNKEINRLRQKNEKRKKSKKIKNIDFFNICFKLIIIFIFFAVAIWLYNINNVKKNIEVVQSLNNIRAPIQTKASGSTTKNIYGKKVDINFVAKYSISGRVVNTHNYYGYNMENQLSPKDVGISWGVLASESNYKKIRWSSTGNRFLYWHSDDGKWLQEMGGTNALSEYYSNNHLIPSDNKVKKLINGIKEDEFIRIEGYLVNIYCKENNGRYFTWNTSDSRSDTGDGACEIIYVTNITWLKTE